jgi:tryptophanase
MVFAVVFSQIELLAGILREAGVPIVEPPGGHAVYIDAAKFLPHIPPHQFPAQALTAALYAESGVRGVEIGSSCFGRVDEETGAFIPAKLELLRLAVPRRVYSSRQLEYVGAALIRLYEKRDEILGLKRVYATKLLSHFTAKFEPLGSESEEQGLLKVVGNGFIEEERAPEGEVLGDDVDGEDQDAVGRESNEVATAVGKLGITA